MEAGMTEQTERAEVEALDTLAESIMAVLTERQPVSYRPRTAVGEAREVLNRILASGWLAADRAAAEARGAERALLPIRRFAEAGAISAKALGRSDRDFLDLIILCDREAARAAARGVED